MSWNKTKFSEIYNRARERAHAKKLINEKEGYDNYDSGCHDSHEYSCQYCNPPLEFIYMGMLGYLIWKLGVKSAADMADNFTS